MSSRFVGGFTLVELLVSSVLLSVAAVGVANLIRMSDVAAMRGRIDAKAGLVFKETVNSISSMPGEELRSFLEEAEVVGPSGALFTYGEESSFFFPFLEGEPEGPVYLLEGKPLPGTEEATGIGDYQISVEISDEVTHFDVRVVMNWEGFRDRVVEGSYEPTQRRVTLQFEKWDSTEF